MLGDIQQDLSDWSALKKFSIPAEAGGWHDQLEEWRHDMLALDNMYSDEFNALAKTVNGRR